ncbi:hypothetical protein FACS189447_00770 [Spirochaetia bacterium]|nr:hypothetical protein FACS189447_00770 [Spirochaetia bacterium]
MDKEPEIVIQFNKSAFIHHVSEADIRWAIKTARYEELLDGYTDKYLLLGSDTKGNPVEVVYHAFGENGMYIFHAMPCRPGYFHLLNP